MTTDAASQGQAAKAGTPTSGKNTSATTPEPIEISVVVDSGSSPTLISAFQPAWQAAAKKTAFSISGCHCRGNPSDFAKCVFAKRVRSPAPSHDGVRTYPKDCSESCGKRRGSDFSSSGSLAARKELQFYNHPIP